MARKFSSHGADSHWNHGIQVVGGPLSQKGPQVQRPGANAATVALRVRQTKILELIM